MPTMMEIYRKYSSQYDELVSAEDYKNNLWNFLNEKIDWKDKIVYEAGIGTGRVTKNYISLIKHCYGFDRENHMIKKCRENLSTYEPKLTLNRCDNQKLERIIDEEIDVFIEGWSFGHTIVENSDRVEEISDQLITNVKAIIKEDGDIVIIESAGTNVELPTYRNKYLNDFLKGLVHKYHFKEEIVRTDYRFTNYKEAARIMGFFFGDEMGKDIFEKRKATIKEFTGIWIR